MGYHEGLPFPSDNTTPLRELHLISVKPGKLCRAWVVFASTWVNKWRLRRLLCGLKEAVGSAVFLVRALLKSRVQGEGWRWRDGSSLLRAKTPIQHLLPGAAGALQPGRDCPDPSPRLEPSHSTRPSSSQPIPLGSFFAPVSFLLSSNSLLIFTLLCPPSHQSPVQGPREGQLLCGL